MKKLLLVLLLVFIISGLPVLASDISNAEFSGVITVSNNSTATENVSTIFTCNTTALIDNGYVNSALSNTAIRSAAGADLAYMPGYDGNPWCLWVPAIGANTYLSDILYTGGPAMDGYTYYFPDDDGMTTSDSATLELSDNFTLEQSGRVDTAYSANKTLAYKPGASVSYISDTGNISFSMSTAYIENWDMEANSDWTNGAGAGGSRSNTRAHSGTYSWKVETGSTVYQDLPFVNSWRGEQFTFSCWVWHDVADKAYLTIDDGVGTTNSAKQTGSSTWEHLSVTQTLDSAATQLRIILVRDVSATDAFFDDATMAPVFVPEVMAPDVDSGEHVVTISMDSPFISLGIDATSDPISDPITPTTVDLLMNAPLWQDDCDHSPFTTIDSTEYACTVTGATWTTGGYSFDGVNDKIDVANTDVLSLNAFTFTYWMKAGAFTGTNRAILYWNDAVNFGIYERLDDTSNTFDSRIKDTGGHADYLVDSFSLNTWEQWGYAYDGTHLYRIHNGIRTLVDSGFGAPIAPGLDMVYGVDHAGNQDYDGLIGGFRWDDAELTDAEVLQNYNAEKSKFTSGDIYTYSTLSSVPDNDNDWTFLENGSMPYMVYQKFWIGGDLQQHIIWEYDTTFSDQSGNGHDATPNFRGSSSDADVSAALFSFAPIEESDAPSYALDEPPDFITSTPGMTGDFDTSTSVNATYPGHDVIKEIAIAGGVPERLPTTIMSAFGLIILSLSITAMFKRNGSNTHIIKTSVVFAAMCILIAVGVMEVWQAYFYGIMALGIMWMARQREAY